MTGWVAMTPGSLGDGAGRCREVSRQARLVVANVGGLPQPAGMPAHVSVQLHAAMAQLRRSADSAEAQSAWLIHRSHKGLIANGPMASLLDVTAPPLVTPWAMPPPPPKPLLVPDPNENLIDRLFGRDDVLPEDAVKPGYLENGVNPTYLLKVLQIEARSARTSLAKVPGGNLKVHEERGGHTLLKHVNKTVGDLRARLRSEPLIPAASAFTDRAVAEDAVAGILTMNRPLISSGWLRKAM